MPVDQGRFGYGALFADPLPIGGAGIPPTLLMQDMRHYVPDYLKSCTSRRGAAKMIFGYSSARAFKNRCFV